MTSTTKTWKAVYYLSVLLRFSCLFLTGYIHPDEFFQSPSITAQQILNLESQTPWEFQLHSPPQRTILTPMIISGIPFLILQVSEKMLSSFSLFIAPRLFLFLISLIMDTLIFKMLQSIPFFSKSKSTTEETVAYLWRAVFSMLWPVILFHTRPFSNTAEAFVLMICFYLAFYNPTASPSISKRAILFQRTRCLFLGVASAFGFFTRFTFPFFAWPLCLYCILFANQGRNSNSSNISVSRFMAIAFMNGLDFLLGFLTFSFLCAGIDTFYFNLPRIMSRGGITFYEMKWVVTPLNNLLYNMDPKNLAEHTLHPNYLHLLVNFPMLFGAFALWLLWQLVSLRLFKENTSTLSFEYRALRWVSLVSILSGIGLLSMAPHQEPRFLLPIATPLIILFAISRVHSSQQSATAEKKPSNQQKSLIGKTLLFLIILHSALLIVFFGALHQAGIVKSLNYISQQSHDSKQQHHYIYIKTYMPPTYLAAIPRHHSKTVQIHDLAGSSIAELQQYLQQDKFRNQDSNISVLLPKSLQSELESALSCGSSEQQNWCADTTADLEFWPHLSTEHFSPSLVLSMHKMKYKQ